MTLSSIWKEQMKGCLIMMYGDKISEEFLDRELDRQIEIHKKEFPNLMMRNIYTGHKNIPVPLDDILDIVAKEDLCISANNTLTYSYRKIKSPIPAILIKSKADRNYHKNKAKQVEADIAHREEMGENMEGSELLIQLLLEEAMQLKIKAFMNSIYGVQGQPGSIIYSPDTAGAVTSQGRQLISEMLWSIERLLYGTLHFSNFGEYMSYLYTIKKDINYNSEYLKYISYVPTKEDVMRQVALHLKSIAGVDVIMKDIDITLFHFIENMTDVERIHFYYNSNCMELISRNVKVFDLIDQMLVSPTKFMATGSDTPKDFRPILDTLCKILDEFVIVNMSTAERVFKYMNKRRRGIIVSDTDSVIVNLHPYIENLYKLHCMRHGLEFNPNVGFANEDMDFKLVNIVSYFCIHATDIAGDILCKQGNVPQELRSWIEMKNEFLFKRLVMYTSAKKNYICHTRLREGNVINKISTTGIKLNSSTINVEIKAMMMDIIENDILKTEKINAILILKKVKDIERFIIRKVKEGDFMFGKKSRFSGMNAYKTGVFQSNAGRSCLIWNLLNPTCKISSGDYCYIFNTNLYTLKDAEKLKYQYPEVYEALRIHVFENEKMPELAKYGLKSIAIPITETVKRIPEWIIPFIDYENLTNKHLQPIITLLPSISINLSKLNGTKTTYSPLISF